MDSKEFRDYLSKQQNKFAVFLDKSITSQFEFSMSELINIVVEQLSDEEKSDFVHKFVKISSDNRLKVISSIQDDKTKLDILREDLFKDDKNVYTFKYVEVVKTLGQDGLIEYLHDSSLREMHGIKGFTLKDLITKSDQEIIIRVLDDEELMKELFGDNLSYDSSEIISAITDDEKKVTYIEPYDASEVTVYSSCTDDTKTNFLLSDKNKLSDYDITLLLKEYSEIDKLFEVIQEHSDFLKAHEISLYSLIDYKDEEFQIQFVEKMMESGVEETEQLMVLARLDPDVKERINKDALTPEQVNAVDMKIKDYEKGNMEDIGFIIIDYSGDMSRYKGFDKLLRIRPQRLTNEERAKAIELAKICPDAQISDNLNLSDSTTQEFLNAEKWISEVISKIQPEWTDVQKLAYIDHCVGKKISYSPDFDTEVEKQGDERALWRIIDSGYGVCNGIAQVEQYMLKQVGIESELITSKSHSYLKINNIEIPRSDGTVVKGDTLHDPTWNLASNRFDAYPNHFCRDYKHMREFDVLDSGEDRNCHKNDEKLDGVELIEIEESVVRNIYKSLGLAREDGKFLISDMVDLSDQIAKSDVSLEEKFDKQLSLLKQFCPEFVQCQNSSLSMITNILLNHEEMDFEKAVASRVYEKSDNDRNARMYVWSNLGNGKEVFFVADPQLGEFVRMDRETFVDKFECYDRDLEKKNGVRPWDSLQKEEEIPLENSSGKVAANKQENEQNEVEGEER